MPSHSEETADVFSTDGSTPQQLVLLVFTGDGASTHPLPESGAVTIGRAPEADIRIDVPALSRQHAVLELGPDMRIQDSGSANGTRVGEKAVLAGNWAPVRVGEVIELGTVVLIIQRSRHVRRPRRVWTHSAFEGRLDEACRTGSPFAVIRIALSRGETSSTRIAEALAQEIGDSDCLAAFGGGEYEVLLAGVSASRAADRAEDLVARLEDASAEARTGVACFPIDGREPETLIAHAGRELAGIVEEAPAGQLVVADPAMAQLYKVIDRLARGEIGIFINGETGVGKEVVAEEIHRRSTRRSGPYVRVNCAALTETLFESELFGHQKGAFTGATEANAGLVQSAEHGTLFLDEVGELTAAMQSKMLRVVEEKSVRKVGATKSEPVDVRFIAASNRDLPSEVAAGRFRQDLFYRLGVQVMVPPLRERPADVEPLARSFIANECARLRRPTLRVTDAAWARLRAYRWPGNIRELRNVVERAVLLCEGDTVDVEHLPLEKMDAPLLGAPEIATRPGLALSTTDSSSEREALRQALAKTAGNQTEAAKLLGISRRMLLYRLDAYGVPRPRKKAPGN